MPPLLYSTLNTITGYGDCLLLFEVSTPNTTTLFNKSTSNIIYYLVVTFLSIVHLNYTIDISNE